MAITFFYTAILIYGTLSSPTPDAFSIIEYIIAGCLILSIGFLKPINLFTTQSLSHVLTIHKGILIYLLTVPLAYGIISGFAPTDIIRDIIPILFLILPLCFYGARQDGLLFVMAIAGGFFALRYSVPFLFPSLGLPNNNELLYLANSPLVPFAAIIGCHWLTDSNNAFLSRRIFGALLMLVCFIAMAAMMQRAPLALTGFACAIIFILRLIRHPVQTGIILGIMILVAMPFLGIMTELFNALGSKTALVGWNNRIEEFQAVMQIYRSLAWGGVRNGNPPPWRISGCVIRIICSLIIHLRLVSLAASSHLPSFLFGRG